MHYHVQLLYVLEVSQTLEQLFKILLRSIHFGFNKHFLFFLFLSISVNSNNVQSLLNAANQYQVEPVKKMCVDFLKEQVDATNCLGKRYCSRQIHALNKVSHLVLVKMQSCCDLKCTKHYEIYVSNKNFVFRPKEKHIPKYFPFFILQHFAISYY